MSRVEFRFLKFQFGPGRMDAPGAEVVARGSFHRPSPYFGGRWSRSGSGAWG
jgi:hypothetical protein